MFAFDPYSPAVDADPFPLYAVLRDEHPCFYSEEARMWVLSRYADVLAAGLDWKTFSSAKGNLMTELPNRAGATLGTTDPPRHDRLRGLIQHAFMKRNLEGLSDPIRRIAADAAGSLRGRTEFEFIGEFSAIFTVRVLAAALGLPLDDETTLREKAVLMVQSDPVTRAKGPQHLAAYQWMQDFAAAVIAERRTVAADPTRLPDAIEESLRFNTSAQRFRRNLQKDVSLHGRTMRAGEFVCLAYGAANRDERQFPNAAVYDLARKPRGHLGFGGGVHACLGTQIARLSVKIAFEELHKVLPEYGRTSATLGWMPSSTFRSPLRLDLAVH
ncbi:MAG: cytochrome P450 [Gammaproteobacteria bacterium]|nr:cytochrome P450 [Gammaproteobacteria bacterium]MDE2348054.1 cytochrome P450 [Gammaproteobacteria bacterium]